LALLILHLAMRLPLTANPDRSGDHPLARPAGVLQAQNFSNLPHRQSLGGHRTSHCANRKRTTLPRSDCRQRSPPHPINRVAAFVRNRWPLSIGLGGRFPSESVAALPRIPHPVLVLWMVGSGGMLAIWGIVRCITTNKKRDFRIGQSTINLCIAVIAVTFTILAIILQK
jgi:hypothetical protein